MDELTRPWHTLSEAVVAEEFGVESGSGLSHIEAVRRLGEYGLNLLPEAEGEQIAAIFLRQFQNPLIYTLIGAAIVVLMLGEQADAYIIFFVLLFNAIVGTLQEGRAQSTLRALKRFASTQAVVMREGKELIISDTEVVPGDVILLHEGARVPADARVILSHTLKADEAALTGESVPVHKIVDSLVDAATPALEQVNMVFKGTHIVAGSGKAIVVTTGIQTLLGGISREVASLVDEIPLKKEIARLSRMILLVVSTISVTLFAIGIASGKEIIEMFSVVVSLAVSIIPEGLPIVMTLVLAAGVWQMSRHNALVKRLQAVETLGQARVIAVDKTGTLTKNEMVVQQLYIGGREYAVGGVGYEPKGDIHLEDRVVNPANHAAVLLAGKIAALSATARAVYEESSGKWQVTGDPTEAALYVFGEKVGFHKDELENEMPKLADIPFDYRAKYHAVLHTSDRGSLLSVVGAPEAILAHASRVWIKEDKTMPLTARHRDELEAVFLKMSGQGLRVVACGIAKRKGLSLQAEEVGDLTFVGFFGMKDALRPEVLEAVTRTKEAGIRLIMITGDHAVTAAAIGKEAGICNADCRVVTGAELDQLSDEQLEAALPAVSVFARVTPEHKLRIIRAFKNRGEIVAMTGDGVNDAPSLVAADLGVAMGKIGTEVAKEAADIVLLDDNFGNIVLAVEEGRSIYQTLKKVILYLFSTSLGEVLTISVALVLGYPLPLLAAQIIWLNLVTDGFLDMALAMEPKEEGLLAGTFERPKQYFLDGQMLERMVVMAIPMAVGTLVLFSQYAETDIRKAWTISLTTLAVFQWFNAWNCRHDKKSLFTLNPFTNIYLVGATIIVIALQFVALYNPNVQALLRTTPLSLGEWGMVLAVGSSIIVVEEVRKSIRRSMATVQM